MTADPFSARKTLTTPLGDRAIWRLDSVDGGGRSLPYCIQVLLEAALRNLDGHVVREEDVRAIAAYDAQKVGETEIPFMPGRVVLQDFTGVPAVVDLAAMRSAMKRMGGDPTRVNPLVPCDLVIDHSVQVDYFGSAEALMRNSEREFERNRERYEFLKWGQNAFDNFRVVPPATGIVHQVNLEYLAKVVWEAEKNGATALYPDSLVGTDSHTTMINGLGVVGWGGQGIEAEAVMLGQRSYMPFRKSSASSSLGSCSATTATDLVLCVTQMLRKQYGREVRRARSYGAGLRGMLPPATGRPISRTWRPSTARRSGSSRSTRHDGDSPDARTSSCARSSSTTRSRGCGGTTPARSSTAPRSRSDLGTVEAAMAGPKRPQDRVTLSTMKSAWETEPRTFQARRCRWRCVGRWRWRPRFNSPRLPCLRTERTSRSPTAPSSSRRSRAARNTSNPSAKVAAGLVARNARKKGLGRKPWVKTSLAWLQGRHRVPRQGGTHG
ncbi:MAG: aconitase family protein [Candidatus Eisenbacteria bacterium]